MKSKILNDKIKRQLLIALIIILSGISLEIVFAIILTIL